MRTIKFEIRGTAGLVLHNGQLADPLNPYVKRMKAITGKKKKTEADYENLARLEFDGGFYLDENEMPVIPAYVLEAGICAAAKAQRRGKDAQSSISVVEPLVPLSYKGPKSLDKLWEEGFKIVAGVRVTQSRVMRTRPLLPEGWGLSFTVQYDEDFLDRDKVVEMMEHFGNKIGLCDWRPKYGRFEVTKAQ